MAPYYMVGCLIIIGLPLITFNLPEWNTRAEEERWWLQKVKNLRSHGLLLASFLCFLCQKTNSLKRKNWLILLTFGGMNCLRNLKKTGREEIPTGVESRCSRPVRHSIWPGNYNSQSQMIYTRKPSGWLRIG